MSYHKPGEEKILKILDEKGSLLNKEIMNETGLSNRAVSVYLDSLQDKGLIEREIEIKKNDKGEKIARITKRYRRTPISYAHLLFSNISNFMKEYIDKTTNKELKESINIFSPTFKDENIGADSFVLSDPKHEFRETVLETLMFDDKLQTHLDRIHQKLEELWDSYVIEKNQPTERDIIKKYRMYLSDVLEKAHLPFTMTRKEEIEKKEYTAMLILARDELQEEFPNVEIPEKMIQIRAKEKLDQLKKRGKIQPYNLEHLKLMLNGVTREDFTEDEKKDLEKMAKHLENPKNKKLYESYLERRFKNKPKTLLINPIWGFEQSIEKLAQLFPKDIETYPNYKTYLKTKKRVK